MGGNRGRFISLSDRKLAVELIDEARGNGARLKAACEVLSITDRTYQRWTQDRIINKDKRLDANRQAPKNKLSKEERTKILELVNSNEYANLPPSQIVPKLADKGEYIASESTIYRILREEKLLTHRGKSKPGSPRPLSTHIAIKPNQVWTWDITWLHRKYVKGLYYKLYMIIDIFSRKIVGYEVWEEENAEYAQTLIRKAVMAENINGQPLVLHSDNGAPMKAATFLGTLEKLGVQSSFSRPRVSNDNPYSEALFKTLKYIPKYPDQGFESLEYARVWVKEFVLWYNKIHYHSGINYMTPHDRHIGKASKILANRRKVYEIARQNHPERWTRTIRKWDLSDTVALNPAKEKEHDMAKKQA